MKIFVKYVVLGISLGVFPSLADTNNEDAAAAMARALQDPLANIRMLATDNSINFNAGEDDGETNYNFQLQPVYSIDRPDDAKVNLLARAVIPILGVEPGVVQPPVVPDPAPDEGSQWGLGDTNLQLFISPRSESDWKWGVGPQVSIPTHTSDRQKGPGWGIGLAGVITGNFTEQLSFSAIAVHHVGEDDFETSGIQPMLFYNFKSVPGLTLNYNNMISYNWNATDGNEWNVPIGAALNKTIILKSGDALDLGLGYYEMVEHAEGAPDSQIKFAITWIPG